MLVSTRMTAPVRYVLLAGCNGHEAISQLFRFQLDLLAENSRDVAFDRLLGQKITVELDVAGGQKRYFSGICNSIAQGERDEVFTSYQMRIVPQFWLLTQKAQSRIFQQLTVPEIASMLELPAGTASSRLRRAREHFQAAVRRLEAQRQRRGERP